MPLFSNLTATPITPITVDGELKALAFENLALESSRGKHIEVLGAGSGEIRGGSGIDLRDQFLVFQFNPSTEGPAVLDVTDVSPILDGSDEEPDVLVAVELLAFHVGANENVDRDSRATLRMNFGKDPSSTDKRFDTVFWSIAAGLDLYDQAKGKKAQGRHFGADFAKAFNGKPIEIPGGLGQVTFDVVKHKEPAWWRRIFKFAESTAGKALVSTLGFPAITNQAIQVIDELFERLDDSSPEILFKGYPMRLAFSSHARDAFTGGIARVRVGSLNRGFAVFARGRDVGTIVKANPIYMPAIDLLVPANVAPADLVSGNFEDTLANVTYGVFRILTKKTQLDPRLSFGQ